MVVSRSASTNTPRRTPCPVGHVSGTCLKRFDVSNTVWPVSLKRSRF